MLLLKEKPAIRKLNRYLEKTESINRSEYAYFMHRAFQCMDVESKEKALVDTLTLFPETVAYAMLKLSIRDIDVLEFFRAEYKSSMESFMDDVETDLVIAFGDTELFLTYARMYVIGLNGFSDNLKKQIRERFTVLKCERECYGRKNKAAFD